MHASRARYEAALADLDDSGIIRIGAEVAEVQALGGNRWDTSSLIVPLRKLRQD